MFTGIVEKSSPILKASSLVQSKSDFSEKLDVRSNKLQSISLLEEISDESTLRISILKPEGFNDLKNGDSICVNGVCLTVVQFSDQIIDFDLGPETLKITGWTQEELKNKIVNLERSMKFGDRIHGHFLSGHVDEVGEVVASYADGEAWFLNVSLSEHAKNYVWKKGSLGLSGVSLTVNSYLDSVVSVCLIPETIKLTNLSQFKVGDKINIEFDWMAKAFYNQIKNWNEHTTLEIKGMK